MMATSSVDLTTNPVAITAIAAETTGTVQIQGRYPGRIATAAAAPDADDAGFSLRPGESRTIAVPAGETLYAWVTKNAGVLVIL